ncbi:DUF3809 family protein [Thermus sediminis]|uniref:DUF3809 family protein n=1 Tax=Thermus sediminis TaxID=1761908 RepID=UPI000E3BCD5B|nr:DUF3809 family protein [Thermus sediminis]
MRVQLELCLNGEGPKDLPLEVFWEGDVLKGTLRQENPILGEILLPFQSRLEGQRLTPLPLPPPSLAVRGEVRPRGEGLLFRLEVALVLPEARNWGERAFFRLLQAVFLRTLEKALSQGRGIGV